MTDKPTIADWVCEARNLWHEKHEDNWLEDSDNHPHPDVFIADFIASRLAQQPAWGGEIACWAWVHPDGDSGGWWDIRDEPEGSPYMQKMRSEGCRIEYAYRASPRADGEVDDAMVRRALHYCPSDLPSPDKWRWIAHFINKELNARTDQQEQP